MTRNAEPAALFAFKSGDEEKKKNEIRRVDSLKVVGSFPSLKRKAVIECFQDFSFARAGVGLAPSVLAV